MFPIAFCVSGKGRLMRAAVRCAAQLGIRPAAIVLDEKAAPDLDIFCRDANIPHTRLDLSDRQRFDDDLVRACREAQPGAIFLTFDKLVPPALVDQFPHSIVNVHMSLLPAFRGFGALSGALNAGVKLAGPTLHLVDGSVDGGPIISQGAVPVRPADTPADLGARIYRQVLPMYLQLLAWFAADRVTRDDAGRVWIRDAAYEAGPIVPAIEPAIAALATAHFE